MTPESPPHGASPRLPVDIFRIIAENFRPTQDQDRHALLCLALASKAWCDESQRVLFRTVTDEYHGHIPPAHRIRTHILFLETVYASPTRLALYVQLYNQSKIAIHPSDKTAAADTSLWRATQRVLPILANLKHLYIVPYVQAERTPFPKLTGCLFKLRTLRWGSIISSNKTPDFDSFIDFLRTQDVLKHIEVGTMWARDDGLGWLPAGVCPNLTSAYCRVDAARYVVGTHRKIMALQVRYGVGDDLSLDLSTLSGLRYLKTTKFTLKPGLELPRTLVLLDVSEWTLETIECLRDLSSLLVLALWRWGDFVDLTTIDLPDLRRQAATKSFQHCPNLACVLAYEQNTRYSKMTVSSSNSGQPGTVPQLQIEEISIPFPTFERRWWADLVYAAGVEKILGI